MAKILDKDPATYDRERDAFLKDLQHFHETRGTPIKRPPKINGHEIDLYLLYVLVTGRGGWVKVNSKNEWDLVQESFKISRHCVNSCVALKQIYLRYLDRYEKVHFLGEVGERSNDDDEDSRHRRWSARALHSVPLTYNHTQHTVSDSLRSYNGLSVDLYKPTEYDKLALSLISPLPNEQDFAINVCTLLSNEGKHLLKLDRHPRLLHFLLGHAAVFDHFSTREVFVEHYSKVRGHSILHFWTDVLEDRDLLVLLDESKYVKRKKCRYIGFSSLKDGLEKTDGAGSTSRYSQLEEDSDVIMCDDDTGLRLVPEDRELFCLGRTLGTQDYIGQRVLQIAMILRNLSFTEENVIVMGKDITFLRFIMLCCGSRWNSLHQLGLDMLANVASEIALSDMVLDPLLSIINKGLESQDRAIVLSCVEILNKLGQNETNEEVLLRCLDDKIYSKICSFLTLQDIMLLVHTLECLYSLSSLGERSCNAIVRVHGSLDTLISLITVEAQSYGPKACVLMRVVETVSNVSQVATSSTANATSVTPTSATTTSTVAASSSASSTTLTSGPMPTPIVARPVMTTPTAVSVHVSSPSPIPASVVVTPSSHSHPIHTPTTPVSTQRGPQKVVPVTTVTTQQVAQENEQFALNWLRTNFEPLCGSRIEQGELYKQYITLCAKIGRRGVIAPNHFPRVVRTAFGASVGPRQTMVGDTAVHHYEGLQVRGTKLINQQQQTTQTMMSPQGVVSGGMGNSPGAMPVTLVVPHQTMISPQQRPPTPQQQPSHVQIQTPTSSTHVLAPPTPPPPQQSNMVTTSTQAVCTSPVPSSSSCSSNGNSMNPSPSMPVSPILKAQLCAPPKPPSSPSGISHLSPPNMTSTPVKPVKKETKSKAVKVSSHPHLSQALRGVSNSCSPSMQPSSTVPIAVASTVTNTTMTITSSTTTSSTSTSTGNANAITDTSWTGAATPVPTSASAASGTVPSSSSTSLIKSLLANKVTDPPHISCATSSTSSLISGMTGHLAIDRSHLEQVTQRQRLLQQQQHQHTTTAVQSVQASVQTALGQVRSPTASPVPTTVAATVTLVNSVPKGVPCKPALSRINGVRAPVKQVEAAVEMKMNSDVQVQSCFDKERNNQTQTNNENLSGKLVVVSSTTTVSTGTVTENHIGGLVTPQQILVPRPVPQAIHQQPTHAVSPVVSSGAAAGTVSVSTTSTSTSTTMCMPVNKHYPNTRLDMDDSNSTGNNSLASSSGIRDNCSATGGEEGENSLTSFEGFLNGVPHSLDVDDTTSKDSAPKSLMLADLLEKTVEKNEPPVLNGALRLGERGLELSPPPPPIKQRPPTPVVAANISTNTNNGNKRPNDDTSIEPDAKRLHVNGDASNDEPPEEGSVSSTAANLYAALAADVVGEEDMEEEPPTPPQPLIVTHAPGTRQILVTAGGQIALQQRVSVMGQHYVVAQPQTALVQGQTQTVLVAQTAQQQGTATKTIIILQPQTAQAPPQPPPPPAQQKVIVQRLQSPPPPPLMSVQAPSPSPCPSPSLQQKQQPMKMLRAVPSPPTQPAPVIVSSAIITQQHTQTHVVHAPMTHVGQHNQAVQSVVVSQHHPAALSHHGTTVVTQTVNCSTQSTPAVMPTHHIVSSNASNVTNVITSVAGQHFKTGSHVVSRPTTPNVRPSANVVSGSNIINNNNSNSSSNNIVNNDNRNICNNNIINNSSSSSSVNNATVSQVTNTPAVMHSAHPHHVSTITSTAVTTSSMVAMSTFSSTTTLTSSGQRTLSPVVAASVASTGTVTMSTSTSTPTIQQGHFLCEWRGCMRNFRSANEVYMHACENHCPQGSQEIQCLWERCDAMKRKRFSLMTHLYDRHCNPDVLRMMAVRRKQLSVSGRSEIPAPSPPTPHPGYAPNAAFHAIKRHALEFVNPKELQDDNEGPVTKSIRLTSALIIRNLVIYSTYGRRYLTSYEPHLASVALSNVESSRTIAQVLFDMSQPR